MDPHRCYQLQTASSPSCTTRLNGTTRPARLHATAGSRHLAGRRCLPSPSAACSPLLRAAAPEQPRPQTRLIRGLHRYRACPEAAPSTVSSPRSGRRPGRGKAGRGRPGASCSFIFGADDADGPPRPAARRPHPLHRGDGLPSPPGPDRSERKPVHGWTSSDQSQRRPGEPQARRRVNSPSPCPAKAGSLRGNEHAGPSTHPRRTTQSGSTANSLSHPPLPEQGGHHEPHPSHRSRRGHPDRRAPRPEPQHLPAYASLLPHGGGPAGPAGSGRSSLAACPCPHTPAPPAGPQPRSPPSSATACPAGRSL